MIIGNRPITDETNGKVGYQLSSRFSLEFEVQRRLGVQDKQRLRFECTEILIPINKNKSLQIKQYEKELSS